MLLVAALRCGAVSTTGTASASSTYPSTSFLSATSTLFRPCAACSTGAPRQHPPPERQARLRAYLDPVAPSTPRGTGRPGALSIFYFVTTTKLFILNLVLCCGDERRCRHGELAGVRQPGRRATTDGTRSTFSVRFCDRGPEDAQWRPRFRCQDNFQFLRSYSKPEAQILESRQSGGICPKRRDKQKKTKNATRSSSRANSASSSSSSRSR